MNAQAIVFESIEFESVIREALKKPEGEIFQSDLKKVTHLVLHDLHAPDIDLLKQCTEVTRLTIIQSKPEMCFNWDFSVLSSLPKVSDLELDNLSAEELEKIGCLTGIESLRIMFVNSFEPNSRISLRAATKGCGKTLKKLMFYGLGNNEFDCEELLDFPALKTLGLHTVGKLLHFHCVSKLKHLEKLSLPQISSEEFRTLEASTENTKELISITLEYHIR